MSSFNLLGCYSYYPVSDLSKYLSSRKQPQDQINHSKLSPTYFTLRLRKIALRASQLSINNQHVNILGTAFDISRTMRRDAFHATGTPMSLCWIMIFNNNCFGIKLTCFDIRNVLRKFFWQRPLYYWY